MFKIIYLFQMIRTIAQVISKKLPRHSIDWFPHTSLLMDILPYYSLAFITLLAVGLHAITGNPLLVFIVLYSILPLIDCFFTIDERNPVGKENKQLVEKGWMFEMPIYVTILLDWASIIYAFNYYYATQFSAISIMKALATVGIFISLQATQFSVSHELMHKPGWRRMIGTLHLLKTLNMHFTYEHVFGHHRRVATPQDPASAPKGVNVYTFFIKCEWESCKNVFRADSEAGKPIWKNILVLSFISNAVFCSLILWSYGFKVLLLFLLQAIGALLYLAAANYIEHYGLRRSKLPNGQYQKINIRHSWNSPHRLSNYLFFKIQRHSDHHENSMKPYQTLLTLSESPQLPHGYIVMMVMTFFPSRFKQVMDPLVDHYNSNQDKIGPEMQAMYSKSIEETRIFIIQFSLVLISMFVLSQVKL